MRNLMARTAALLHALWRTSPPLVVVGLGMLAALLVSLVGLAVDPRVITGMPAWLKPAKFAISTSIYALTIAWVLGYVQDRRRLVQVVGWGTAIILALEVGLIDLQAARGTTSHFNVGTPLDAAIFATMGSAILVAWMFAVAVTVALFRRRFQDRALGWALRAGMVITVLGAGMGGLMTRPTAAQLETARTTHQMPFAGAHTVGAPDGGSGLPGTGWSLDHGDLRVPHFLGLHAIQLVPLLSLFALRRVTARKRERGAIVVGASYAGLFAILLVQALAGESVVAPSSTMVVAFIAWFVATLAGLASVLVPGRNGSAARAIDVAVL